MKEDYESEWWRAKEHDDFNLKTKLLRVGCRPLKRKLLACQKSQDSYDPSQFILCKKIRIELDDCYKALHFLQMQIAQERVENEGLNVE